MHGICGYCNQGWNHLAGNNCKVSHLHANSNKLNAWIGVKQLQSGQVQVTLESKPDRVLTCVTGPGSAKQVMIERIQSTLSNPLPIVES